MCGWLEVLSSLATIHLFLLCLHWTRYIQVLISQREAPSQNPILTCLTYSTHLCDVSARTACFSSHSLARLLLFTGRSRLYFTLQRFVSLDNGTVLSREARTVCARFISLIRVTRRWLKYIAADGNLRWANIFLQRASYSGRHNEIPVDTD